MSSDNVLSSAFGITVTGLNWKVPIQRTTRAGLKSNFSNGRICRVDGFLAGVERMRRRHLLGLLGAGTVMPKFSLASTGRTQRLLVVYSHGGWDVSMLFDPKFSSRQIDTASDGETRSIGGLSYVESPNRPNVRAFMDQFANQSSIINGIGVGSISHTKCERLLFTGSRLPKSRILAQSLLKGFPIYHFHMPS